MSFISKTKVITVFSATEGGNTKCLIKYSVTTVKFVCQRSVSMVFR